MSGLFLAAHSLYIMGQIFSNPPKPLTNWVQGQSVSQRPGFSARIQGPSAKHIWAMDQAQLFEGQLAITKG